jgi:hypothetical protein
VWFRLFHLAKSTTLEVRNVEHTVMGEICNDILEMFSQRVNPNFVFQIINEEDFGFYITSVFKISEQALCVTVQRHI